MLSWFETYIRMQYADTPEDMPAVIIEPPSAMTTSRRRMRHQLLTHKLPALLLLWPSKINTLCHCMAREYDQSCI